MAKDWVSAPLGQIEVSLGEGFEVEDTRLYLICHYRSPDGVFSRTDTNSAPLSWTSPEAKQQLLIHFEKHTKLKLENTDDSHFQYCRMEIQFDYFLEGSDTKNQTKLNLLSSTSSLQPILEISLKDFAKSKAVYEVLSEKLKELELQFVPARGLRLISTINE